MKSELEQTLPLGTSGVWAEEKNTQQKGKTFPATKWWLALIILLALGAISGMVWLYLEGQKSVQALHLQITQNVTAAIATDIARLTSQSQKWTLVMGAAGIGGTLVMLAVAALVLSKFRQSGLKFFLKATEESETRAHHFIGQLADVKVSEEEARKKAEELQTLLHNVTIRHAALEKELDQRRLTEKTLSQQTVQLERSKDVLEMHVQARTQELLKMQRRNESILNSAGDGILAFDLAGRALFANPVVLKATGWKAEDLIGKTEEAIFFPQKARGVKDAISFMKDENGQLASEQVFYRRDGTFFPAEYNRAVIMENGKPAGAVVVFKDITERKLSEDRLNHKAAELARSNRELEQFAFVASHDLQEPLRKIQAFGDRLKVKCESVQLEEGKDYLERMQSAAARMQTLINDLLTFSRVISSSQPFVKVDLKAIAQEVLVDLEVRVEKTGAQVEVGALPAIEADPLQMRQLLQNLIGNALKFQAPGSAPKIKIDAQEISRDQLREDSALPKPAPTASPDDKFCVLTVEDNGIGFEEQYLEKIFAVFQRLHGRSEYEGTGVGLAVCRRITDRHGGIITAQSKPGEGSVFIVVLPLKQPPVVTEA